MGEVRERILHKPALPPELLLVGETHPGTPAAGRVEGTGGGPLARREREDPRHLRVDPARVRPPRPRQDPLARQPAGHEPYLPLVTGHAPPTGRKAADLQLDP
jgi:hypothetical protein